MERDELEGARLAFGLAAQLVHNEPSREQIELYARSDLFCASPFAGDDEAVAAGLALMRSWCAAAVDGDGAADSAQVAAVADDWFNLIGGAGEPKAPSWAGYYLSTNAQILSEETLAVRRLYARYGFELARKNREPDDDLGVMLGFLAHLIGLELESTAEGAAGRGAAADERTLIAERILPWICTWRYSMVRFARTDFYRGAGELVFGLVRAYAARFGMAYNASGEPSYWTVAARG